MYIKRSSFNGVDSRLHLNFKSATSSNLYTVLLGENGSGKSELIKETINNLLRVKAAYIEGDYDRGKFSYSDSLDKYLSNKYKENSPDFNIASGVEIYLDNTNVVTFEFTKLNSERMIKNRNGENVLVSDGEFRYTYNLKKNNLEDCDVIEKVKQFTIISISESSHIKFPIVQDGEKLNYYYPGKLQENSVERYFNYNEKKEVSFKEKTILLSILESTLEGNNAKINEVFSLLGFDFCLDVKVSLSQSMINNTKDLEHYFSTQNNFSSDGISEISKSKIELLKIAIEWYKKNTEIKVNNVFSNSISDISRTFKLDLISQKEVIKNLFVLISSNIVSVSKVKFIKKNQPIEISQISSGQICLISSFSSIAAKIENNSVIFIDEPEISLHPSWSSKYISLLTSIFSEYKGCHFIIATHSPHIISSLPDKDFVLVMNDGNKPILLESKDFNFRSIDFQMAKAFGFPGDRNEYLIRIIMVIIGKVSESEKLSCEDYDNIKYLNEIHPKISSNDPVFHLINQINKLVPNG
ncbi:ATP-binding protein [Vibrio splendidus]|uniref:AAA family ATPase n=1 Tax=Vibrio splendidus TaxID=29497 RepID=UPI0024693CAE|nr:AAA family ATPase [Vibrio splendidus]MDH5903458.1 ATP-binding protein [Vibrio splendidus]